MRGFQYVRPENVTDPSHPMMFCVRLDGYSSDWGVVSPFLTVKLAGHCRRRVTVRPGVSTLIRRFSVNYLSLLSLTSSLYTIARLNYICFERDGPRGAVKL